ncbi:long-chain fatty acid transporter fat1 [Alternaria ventricosa]|uniref:long-chain fatty acid transporter fat1 n=1 Tax=Alternaria ventricosa TaxID=1187951 RepID=UPI0020C532D7|nr:long-chain fatty acid transporter fat1 [Alternaria ventricosa]KAI4641690.1 long-chain fatty acid transporter fat1 [Alternaria ventricosa]
MALPIIAGAAGTAALAAYLNAKHHIAHDLKHARGGLSPTQDVVDFMTDRAVRKRALTYHVFEDQVCKQPNHPFLIFEGRTWSYKEFFDAFTRVGNWLIEDLGIQADEVVAMDGGNSPEYLMLWFALDGIGAIPSFVNWNLTGTGLVHCARICNSRFLIADADVKSNVEPCRMDLEETGVKIHYYNPSFFASLPNSTPIPDSRRDHVTIESLRSLMYTSGTTGLPKAVTLSTGRELLTGYSAAKYLELKPESRMYTCMPLYHGAAHGLCVTPIVHSGGTVVLSRRFSHKTFWPEVAASDADIIQYVGELCRYLLNGPPNTHERRHKVQMAWGNGMRPDVWEPFRERFNIPIINELYAATDGLGATFNRNAGPFTANSIGLRGLIWNWRFSDQEVRVKMDVDTEEIMRDANGFAIRCGVNEPGQVLHRLTPETVATSPGYYNNEGATENRRIRDVFEKGDIWFKSGDMMRQDADGRVFFVDRLGDTFRWKSENVSTNEVADMLGKFPQIAETNAYGVLVPGYDGRAGTASIVMADGVTESTFNFAALAKHARAVLPSYAVPLFLRVTPALEYTGTLKIQKGRLKKEGVDPDKITGEDKLYWLPEGSDRYLPFTKKDWEALLDKRVRLS